MMTTTGQNSQMRSEQASGTRTTVVLGGVATLAAGPGWPVWLLFVFASIFGATAVGWNGVYLAEVARLAPAARISEATGGCLFFTFLGVVVTPPVFNAVLALSASYAVAYAIFGVPALAIGARLLARAR